MEVAILPFNLGVPVMNKKSFTETERDIGEWWKVSLKEQMIEADREAPA